MSNLKQDIKYSCGFCGIPMDENKYIIDEIPENYNPNNYEHNVCEFCMLNNESNRMHQVTKEMAIDAGDRSLEGQWIKW